MPCVQDILANKGSEVQTVSPATSVLNAARLMNKHHIGSLVVTDGDRVIGMFSERDILRRIVVPCRDPGETTVDQVMTTEVICCRPHTTVLEARGVMKNRRIRHMPVVDGNEQLIGLISIGDLNAHDMHEHESTIYIMEQYIYGRT